MVKSKAWWKKMKCRLSGGHRYNSGEISSLPLPEIGFTCFIHRCVKCGEFQVYAVKDSALYSGIRHIEKPEVKFDG